MAATLRTVGDDMTASTPLLDVEHHGDGRSSLVLSPPLTRLDGKLYGGTGLALVIAAMEEATGRQALWATAQFVGSGRVGDRLDCHAEVLAHGRRSSQVRVTITIDGRTTVTGLGSTGTPKDDALTGQFPPLPAVVPPDAAAPFDLRLPFTMPPAGQRGWFDIVELRDAQREDAGTLALWARLDRALDRAGLAFVADVGPMGIARAAGRAAFGMSLDNSIRFGPSPDTEWVLLDLDPHLAAGGWGHGAVRVWAEDGTLLAIASQTATMTLVD